LLNASVGVQRVLGRLRRPHQPSFDRAVTSSNPDSAMARQVRDGFGAVTASARRRTRAVAIALPTVRPVAAFHRLGHDRTVALAVAGIVLGASFLSITPGGAPSGDTGGPEGDGPAPRLAIGGADVEVDVTGNVEEAYEEAPAEPVTAAVDSATSDTTAYAAPAPNVSALSRVVAVDTDDPEAQAVIAAMESADAPVEGPFLADGTLLKPVAVDTTVADGSALVRTYKVKAGDTLVGIAKAHGVSMMTLWWANQLKSKDDLHRGQILKIPSVSGVVVQVGRNDTLASLAKTYKVDAAQILETNGISDPNLVVGQVLVLPGAKGEPIPTPKPTKKPASNSSSGGSRSSNNGGGGSARPPKTYSGGNFAWPAPGGRISQYYHYGHYGLDIDGDTGDRIVAAASGTVTFAGWKGNGGGYQVWIAHGSGLYTTYNHMSSVSVGRGQRVSRGQRIGRMGATGYATGSHLHFEVWKGPIWNGGRRVNPLAYL
jgi:murein DD-endopeptidase MepM/ murein hydrolase activator NlpD